MKTVSVLSQIPDRVSRFREYCLLYFELVQAAGAETQPFSSPELPVFSALPAELQEKALALIQVDLEIFEGIITDGGSLRDNGKLLWRSMSRLGMIPLSDVFDKIQDGDTVEIYLVDEHGQRQVFRSLNFLSYASYTIEQLFSLDWRISATREEKYVRQIGEAAIAIMTGQITQTFDPGIEAHEIRELDSPGLNRVLVKIRYLSPIHWRGAISGAISINRLEYLGSTREGYPHSR